MSTSYDDTQTSRGKRLTPKIRRQLRTEFSLRSTA